MVLLPQAGQEQLSNTDPALQNRLLADVPRSALDVLRPHLAPVSLPVRKVLEEPNKPIPQVVFPLSGVTSVVAGANHHRIEVGMIGREGMTGLSVVLGSDTTPHECFVQIAGDGLCIGTGEFKSVIEASPALRSRFLDYARSFMLQTAQTALANGRCTIEERLARWVLMSRDRLDGDDIPLTHEFLSLMLGVRRPGVTIALQTLEGAKLIRNGRGCITILDRPRLEEIAAGVYSRPVRRQ